MAVDPSIPYENFQCAFRVDFESEEKTFGTWIWDGVKMNTGDCDEAITEKEFALVTSQNCVFIWDFSKKEEKAMSVCTEQCILYLFDFFHILQIF